VLLEVDGLRILTDPVFGERASPVSFMGPRRFHPVPAPISALPKLDVVLLSHDHYDHLCHTSIATLAALDVPFVTALGVGARLEACGVRAERIHELDWHDRINLPGVRFTATPAQHFSGRGMSDRNSTLWASWVIETETQRIFFSGDTGLFPELTDIGKRHGPFDLVMLEIGAFHPAWSDIHLGPENAQRAHEMLGGKRLLPVHWGTFNLAMHDWNEPAETLFTNAANSGTDLLLPRLGLPTEPARDEHHAPWWRELSNPTR
jgi:L-ascorbate metabolism protein UlaG (beta-lactamase superfamily)